MFLFYLGSVSVGSIEGGLDKARPAREVVTDYRPFHVFVHSWGESEWSPLVGKTCENERIFNVAELGLWAERLCWLARGARYAISTALARRGGGEGCSQRALRYFLCRGPRHKLLLLR